MNTTEMAMMDMITSHGLVSFEMFFCVVLLSYEYPQSPNA